MSKNAKTDATIAELEAHADAIRAELKVPKQAELFRHATEAGYLTALADGTVEEEEIAALVKAVELLSEGAVIEWETDALVAECKVRAIAEGATARAETVGAGLKALGQAEAGILVAAIVARATKKIGKKEADVLKAVGKSAGLSSDDVAAIVKRAASLTGNSA